MKKHLIKTIAIFTVLILVACSKKDDKPADTNNSSADQVEEIAQTGDWIITYFYDTDSDETGNFSGYTFSFNVDGTVDAVNGSTSVFGFWSVEDSNDTSDDDAGTDDDDFNILFKVSEDSDFEDLSDDWDIISVTDNKIELIDVSGGNGGTDYLTFEK